MSNPFCWQPGAVLPSSRNAAKLTFDAHVQVFQWQMCSDPQTDAHRFMDAINNAIAGHAAKKYPAFTAWAKLTAAKPRPRVKARKAKQRQDDTALVAQIRCRPLDMLSRRSLPKSLRPDTPSAIP